MNHQNEKKKLHGEWISSTIVLLRDSTEERQGGMLQTERFATIALDVLVRKLLEVQKEGFTKDSYELLQHAILNAINTKSMDVVQVYDNLITAAGRLQAKPLIMRSHDQFGYIKTEKSPQSAGAVLRNTLQAIIFNVSQFSYKQMTESSVEQLNQTMQFAKEAIDENATTHELIFALRSVLGSLLDIQLIKKMK